VIDFLYSVDTWLLLFFNRTLANPLGDFLWPLITDWDKQWPARIVLIAVWLWMMTRGGIRGRTAALLLIPLLFLSDQFNSSLLKEFFHRFRPCHLVDGVPVVPEIRLLVGCGGGMSFPSSHAVNNFAVATLLGYYYKRGRLWMYLWAGIVAVSRPFVGVHYPSDVLGGAFVGIIIGVFVIWVWGRIQRRYFPRWDPGHSTKGIP
jgi:undecaprenyl-diphosphatase